VVEARKLGILVTPCILVPDFLQDMMENIADIVRLTFAQAMACRYALHIDTSCEIGVMVETVRGCLTADQLVVSGPMYMDCIAFDTDKIARDFFADNNSKKDKKVKNAIRVEVVCGQLYYLSAVEFRC
jgi:hypothetical protein